MADEITKKIGDKIRKVRRSNDMTLKNLSAVTGISIPMLSKIETAQSSPPVSTYANIATALGISIGDLFSDDFQESDISIVRSDERPVISRGPYIGSPLAFKKENKKMEPFIFDYPIRQEIRQIFQHENEEMIFVINGVIEFKYGEKIIILKKGDCAYFNGKIRKATALVVQVNE